MALEEFIIDLCEESVNGALLVSRTRCAYTEDAYTRSRPSGCSKHTCMIYPVTQARMRSRPAGGSTTRSSALCLGQQSRNGGKRSRRTYYPSQFSPAWCWPVLLRLSSRDTRGPWQLLKLANLARWRISYRTMCKHKKSPGVTQWPLGLQDPGDQRQR